jgi:inosine-uridine nucleoside N-ribohydrolase
MNLIIETDIGRDPDDFFCLCYLLASGIDIKAITIFPGDEEQIALTRLICKTAGKDIPIGIPANRKTKKSYCGEFHLSLLEKYKSYENFHSSLLSDKKHSIVPDGIGSDIIEETISNHPDCDLLCIGPVTNVAEFLEKSDHIFEKTTFQGGFLPYYLHSPNIRLDKFENVSRANSFNFNQDLDSISKVINSNQLKNKRFVSKNICHSVSYDLSIHKRVVPKCEISILFHSAMSIYLNNHSSKKFHDPLASVCHVHPEIGQWINGTPKYEEEGKWTTVLDASNNQLLCDLDYEAFWEHIVNFT